MERKMTIENISWGEVLTSSAGMLRLDKETRGIDANAISYRLSDPATLGLFTMGKLPPLDISIRQGNLATIWNLYVRRDSEVSDNIQEVLNACEKEAAQQGYEGLFIVGNLSLIVPARMSGFVMRGSDSPDIQYAIKRL